MTGQVSRARGRTQNSEMGLIGYVVGAGIAVIMLPVLPFLAVLWLLLKLFGGGREGPTGRATDGT